MLNFYSMTEGTKKEKQQNTTKPVDDDSINNGASNDHDDEFVSDLHQASSKDIAEADEAMKKLGLTKVIIIIVFGKTSSYLTKFFRFSRMTLSGRQSWRAS